MNAHSIMFFGLRTKMQRISISDGSLEALKWLALLLMTGDHVNKYLFNGTNDLLFYVGRIAMPLFVFVLAYNLARPGILEHGAYLRTMKRLAMFGAIAIPAFIALSGLRAAWQPLNILFTLLVITTMFYLIEQRSIGSYAATAAVFLVAGSSVEFWWPALMLGMAVWWYCKQPSWTSIVFALIALLTLWFVNKNFGALMAVPIVLAAARIDLRVPRLRWVFYAYYPLHLVAIWLIRIPMNKAGYLFF